MMPVEGHDAYITGLYFVQHPHMLTSKALEQLVAASGGVDDDWLQRMAGVPSTMLQLLQQIRQGGSDAEDVQAARQQDLLLCFRVLRNTCAAGPAACAQLLAIGLLDLTCATLDLISTAAISLNWQLPAAVSQALANLCNACADSAAAAWAALFPLHFSMLAHVNAGKKPDSSVCMFHFSKSLCT